MTHDARLPPRDRFEGYYATPRAPWDIGRPQRAFVEATEAIRGRVIDIGCGTGDLAVWLAERGCTVTGVDFLPKPLEAADTAGGMFGAREKRLWDAYCKLHASVLTQFDDDFDSAFGKAFARAYEKAARRG